MSAPARRPSASKPTRKRRRRQASYSASSTDSSSSSEDVAPAQPTPVDASPAASSSSSSSSDSDDTDSDTDSDFPAPKRALQNSDVPMPNKRQARRHPTLSPTPPPPAIPSFLPPPARAKEGEEDRRAAFRRVYMEHLVQGFGGDLEKLRAVSRRGGHERLISRRRTRRWDRVNCNY